MGRRTSFITGASGGIGAQFARRLATDYDLVLVTRSGDHLNSLCSELAAAHPQGVFTAQIADLAQSTGVPTVMAALDCAGIVVDLLVNNAGVGYHGAFVVQAPAAAQLQILLNCISMVALTREILPGMVERGRGDVINVSSTSAFQPVPTMAVYGATKAFVLSFSEALHVETSSTGVEVLALCPGSTQTGFFRAAGSDFLTTGRQSPDQVVTTALRALGARRSVAVSGILNKVSAKSYRFLPRSLLPRGSAILVRERASLSAAGPPAAQPTPTPSADQGTPAVDC